MISENGNTRTYDYENRLTGGTGIATKKYTALSKERGYAYDGLRELVNLGASLPSYVRGARGELLAELSSANSVNYYAYTDHIGSVMAKGNSSGTVTDYAKYDPFGKVLTALPNVAFGFAGARIDAQTNYYSMGARYYNPAQGRFATRDTWTGNVWDSWTWNLYQYANNSPVTLWDPTGHATQSDGLYMWDDGDPDGPRYECRRSFNHYKWQQRVNHSASELQWLHNPERH
jgi:RHS repeat-associated protein